MHDLRNAVDGSGPRAVRRRTILLAMGYYTHARHAGIARYAKEAGWSLDCRLSAFRASADAHARYLGAGRYDGAIVYLTLQDARLTQLIASLNVPTVDLGLDVPSAPYLRVLPDNVAAGRVAAEHLLERGLRGLAFYTHAFDSFATRARWDGFSTRAARGGVRATRIDWEAAGSPPDRARWLGDALRRLPGPLGLLSINDHVAAEAVTACGLTGLRVPQDVAVLGVDNDPLVVDAADVPLSSVDTNRERVGYEAARLLDGLIDGRRRWSRRARPTLVPPGPVVARASTDLLAIADPGVVAALRFVRAHYAEPISVDDVVRQTTASRRWLQDAFRRHVGRTIWQEVTARRADQARRQLMETDRKASAIARDAGFGTAERMSKVFARLYAAPPRAFRDRGQPARLNVADH